MKLDQKALDEHFNLTKNVGKEKDLRNKVIEFEEETNECLMSNQYHFADGSWTVYIPSYLKKVKSDNIKFIDWLSLFHEFGHIQLKRIGRYYNSIKDMEDVTLSLLDEEIDAWVYATRCVKDKFWIKYIKNILGCIQQYNKACIKNTNKGYTLEKIAERLGVKIVRNNG